MPTLREELARLKAEMAEEFAVRDRTAAQPTARACASARRTSDVRKKFQSPKAAPATDGGGGPVD